MKLRSSNSSTIPLALGVLLVNSLLILVVTGTVMWVQHYRLGRRSVRAH